MEDRAKREEHIKKAVTGLERKIGMIEKRLADQSSSIGATVSIG
jgi:hypothetical protein